VTVTRARRGFDPQGAEDATLPAPSVWRLRRLGGELLLIAICIALAACASNAPAAAEAREPHEPRPLPAQGSVPAALDALGRRLYAAVARGHWDDVLFDDVAIDALLEPAAARLASTASRTVLLSPEQRGLWNGARYAGLCVQQGRLEPASGAVGLRAAGFVFERALLIGREPGGGAIAGWVDGRFLNTDAGFGALSVERVETPRRDHADLELQVCELRVLADAHKRW